MKRLLLTAFFLCLVSVGTLAQSNDQAKPIIRPANKFNLAFWESSATYWTGSLMDYQSSLGYKEANPLVRNDTGGISRKKLAINVAFYGLTVALQTRFPRVCNWMRRGLGWLQIGVAVRNYSVDGVRLR